jgi:hypothetical protein
MVIMLVAGTGDATPIPATALPAPLTRPYDKHRETPEETVGVFYQHMDHQRARALPRAFLLSRQFPSRLWPVTCSLPGR